MPHYFIGYYKSENMPATPEAGAQLREQWKQWLAELGAVAVSPQNPFAESQCIKGAGEADPVHKNPFLGFSIIQSSNMDEALTIAKNCPYLAVGSIEVAEIMQM